MDANTRTVAEARDDYFARWGFGDGGYEDRWVKLQLGPIPLRLWNFPARKRAVKLHDLHHVATGYNADWLGEFEISAWELGGSCGGFGAAWLINSQGLVAGALRAPRRTFAAFVRGRQSRTLYLEEPDVRPETLQGSVAALRQRLRLDRDAAAPSAADRAWFAAAVGLAALVNLGPVVALAAWWLKA